MGCFFFSSYSAKFAAVRPRTGLPEASSTDTGSSTTWTLIVDVRLRERGEREQRRGDERREGGACVRYGLSTATLDVCAFGHALLVHRDLQRRNLRGIVELEDELRAAGDRNRAEQLRLRRRLPRQLVGRGAVDDQRHFVRRRGAGDEVLAVQLERIRACAAAVGALHEQPLRLLRRSESAAARPRRPPSGR